MSSGDAGHRLCIHATYDADGATLRTWLIVMDEDGRLALWEEPAPAALLLPPMALPAVFSRYGKPLDEDVEVPEAPALVVDLPGGAYRIRPLRFRPFGYLEPLDYLVLDRSRPGPGEGPLAAPAPLVAAALRALARAAAATRSE